MKRQDELGSTVNRIVLEKKSDVDTFRFGRYETVLLEKGDMIYRLFTPEIQQVTKGTHSTGFFWFDKKTFDNILRSGGIDGVPNAARAGLAVKHEWSETMNRMTIGQVNEDFLAAYGPTQWQTMSGFSNVYHIGGLNQLYILQKDWKSISMFSSVAF